MAHPLEILIPDRMVFGGILAAPRNYVGSNCGFSVRRTPTTKKVNDFLWGKFVPAL
jgi:hypothetical protein